MQYRNCLGFYLAVFLIIPASHASVCITAYNPVIYGFSRLSADFNNDGIADRYEILDESSIISLSVDSVQYSHVTEIEESWAVEEGMLASNYGIPTELIGGDVNNDGFTDVLASFGARVVVKKNDGNGGFSDSVQYLELAEAYGVDSSALSVLQSEYNAQLLLSDINGDGYDDLIVLHINGLHFYVNDTMGNFSLFKHHALTGLRGSEVGGIYAIDLHADSREEIVVSTSGSHVVYVDSDFSTDSTMIPNRSDHLEVLDYEGDGDQDFMEVSFYSTCIPPVPSDTYRYWINDGKGAFREKVVSNAYDSGDINLVPVDVEQTADKSGGSGSIGYGMLSLLLLPAFLRIKSTRV